MNKGSDIRSSFLILVSLVIAVLAVFWQVQNYEFVNFDDGCYVTENHQVQAGLTREGFTWAFTTVHANFWHPLTWLSHMLDCELYGVNAGGHHLTNVLIHIVNTLLLFLVLKRITAAFWQSTFVAAIFALHPLHVESVAWVAERKDMLSGFFWVLTIGFYTHYVERPGFCRYLIVLLSFAVGLLAKPMLVTLPFVLLLLDYWPFKRFHPEQPSRTNNAQNNKTLKRLHPRLRVARLIWEKAPLFILAVASSIIAFLAQQHGGAVKPFVSLPVGARVANALLSYTRYIGNMIWPQDLTVFYPHPGSVPPIWQVTMCGFLLLSISVLVIRTARRHPYLVTGWLWYLGTLLPVIGLVQVGDHAMADRYTYIPLIGLSIMTAWAVPEILTTWRHRKIVLATSTVGIVLVLALCSWFQVRHWRNSITLFEHMLRITPNSPLAHTNLGIALAGRGKLDNAIGHYSRALQMQPDYLEAHVNLGAALAAQGKLDEAVTCYSEALQIKPDFPEAHYNLGNALARQGKQDQAIAHYLKALQIEPQDAETHNNLGIALAVRGRIAEAAAHFREALEIKSHFVEAHHNLAVALQKVDIQNASQ